MWETMTFRNFKTFKMGVSYGEPMKSSLKMLSLSIISPILKRQYPVLLNLPDGLKALCYLNHIEDAWLNMLHIYFCKDYEQIPWFKPRRGWRVLDIGAYIGLYTLRCSKLICSQGLVVSVEPLKESLELLLTNVRLNKLTNVKVINACVSPYEGPNLIYVPQSPINATLTREYVKHVSKDERVEKVKGIGLDYLINRFKPIDLMKIDIEGAELEVLKKSRELQPNYVKRVVVEVHRNVVQPRHIAGVLEGKGYDTALYMPEDSPLQAFLYAY